MEKKFMILNYSTNTIIRWCSAGEVCAICKALMKMPNPSFDVFSNDLKPVTSHFTEMEDDSWIYDPPPVAG